MGELLPLNTSDIHDDSLIIKVTIDNHIVVDSKCCYNSYKDLKTMLKNKSPAEFIRCCTNMNGAFSRGNSISASMALENAYGIIPSINESIFRDIIQGLEFLQHHIKHFYMLTVPFFVKLENSQKTFSTYSSDFRLSDCLSKNINRHYLDSMKCIRITNQALSIFKECFSNMHYIVKLKSLISYINNFIESYMLEDLNIISTNYEDYFHKGASSGNFISFGAFHNQLYDNSIYVNPGVIVNNKLDNLNAEYISEDTYKSWYGENLKLSFPNNNFININLNKPGAYTFIKAPRYNGFVMEAGALARMIISGNYKLCNSSMDRISAIVLEARLIADKINHLCDLSNWKKSDSRSYVENENCCGISYLDTCIGAISHYINIKSSKIAHCEILFPYFWNLSPNDMNNLPGTLETALLGTYINKVNNPIELIRIVNSFGHFIPYKIYIINNNKLSHIIEIK